MAASAKPQGDSRAKLRRLGLCGADDSVDPNLLALISAEHDYVEWGVLFRPDREGQPRYATPAWVDKLAAANKAAGGAMRLAGHLCGDRVPQVLGGDPSFVKEIAAKGFARVQVNATAINGVDTSRLDEGVEGLRSCMKAVPEVEWIVQLNDETRPLWDGLVRGGAPENMSVLYDASCGTGVLASSFPSPHPAIPCGYAGGMGPDNIESVLKGVATAAGGRHVWVDMESSLRAQLDGADVFSVDKCFRCIQNASENFVHVERAGIAGVVDAVNDVADAVADVADQVATAVGATTRPAPAKLRLMSVSFVAGILVGALVVKLTK